ncbi:hypothetical protein FNU76_04215 [Chitinimonas arctica]|uniref:Uncharacterized protein n=1 Tax=Chitinimonas arctica TaxID=2594795 RepID=A0A516SBV0_9NEIS|nr:hypothetical protein [Chitinimonas arctica]QDQ25621.1 hypothetical protein FNU76_04215 [Chitinimonas arctica]
MPPIPTAIFHRLTCIRSHPSPKQPDKPAPSRSPEKQKIKEYNLQYGLLGPWTVETFANVSLSPSTIVDACRNRAPLLPAAAGGIFSLAGGAFGLVDASLNWRATIKMAIAIRKTQVQKRDNKPDAKKFEASKTAERKEAGEPTPIASPLTGAYAHAQYREAKIGLKQQIKAVPTSAVEWARDGVLQVGNAGLSIIGAAEALGAAVHLAAPAAGIAGGAASVASGVAHIVQGGLAWRATNNARQIAKLLRDKMEGCLDRNHKPSLAELAAAREGLLKKDGSLPGKKIPEDNVRFYKYKNLAHDFKLNSRTEYEHIQNVYKSFYEQFRINQDAERSAQKEERSHAKKRILYGAIGVAAGVTTIALAATGVGLIALAAIGAAALLAGGLWIAYSTRRNRQLCEQARKAWHDNTAQKKTADALHDQLLATLEAQIKTDDHATNNHLAATLLARHLGGGKEAAKAWGARTREDIAEHKREFSKWTAVDNGVFNEGKGATIISEAGLKIRRKFSVLFLLRTGMSEHDIHELKVLLANGQKGTAIQRISQFLSNDGGRALWKPEASESSTIPI